MIIPSSKNGRGYPPAALHHSIREGESGIPPVESSLTRGHVLMEMIEQWKLQDALETYEVKNWGKGYFGVNELGHVTVHPNKRPDQAIDLKLLIDQLQDRGIQ